MKISYLGPKGTFTEEAVHGYAKAYKLQAEYEAYSTIDAALEAMYKGAVDLAVVPIENSLGGTVLTTSDYLAEFDECEILGELLLPIVHYLWGSQSSIDIKNVKKVYSHPQALCQCKGYLDTYLPRAERVETSSTAEAAQLVSQHKDSQEALVGGYTLGLTYDLSCLAKAIQDNQLNTTRFIGVRRKKDAHYLANKKADKVSVWCQLDGMRPGSLCESLLLFAKRHINLVRIESRPAKGRLGEYTFFFDIAIPGNPQVMTEALEELKQLASDYRFLGAYESKQVERKEFNKVNEVE